MRKYNVAIIAGYNVLADQLPEHREYVLACLEHAKKICFEPEGDNIIMTLGGASNPDYPDKTEAEATLKIVLGAKRPGDNFSAFMRERGNTAKECIGYLEDFLYRQLKGGIGNLLICTELSRLANFQQEALQLKALDWCQRLYCYGHPFQETPKNFDKERKKSFWVLFSHLPFLGPVFTWIRNWRQKRHQRKVAGWMKEGVRINMA